MPKTCSENGCNLQTVLQAVKERLQLASKTAINLWTIIKTYDNFQAVLKSSYKLQNDCTI